MKRLLVVTLILICAVAPVSAQYGSVKRGNSDPTSCQSGVLFINNTTGHVWSFKTGVGCFDQSTGGGGGGADTNLGNISSVAINASLTPGSAGAIHVGSATKPWGFVYFAGSSGTPGTNNFELIGASTSGTRTISMPDSNTLIPIFSQRITFIGPTAARTVTLPDSATSVPIASQTLTFTGMTAARTITIPDAAFTVARIDAANAFVGASTASAWVLTSPTITTKISPTSDDGAPLGDTTHNFSDLFLATGAVINFANSNVVITHSSGILTMGTGEFRITSAGTNTASVVTVGSTTTFINKTITASSNVLGAVTMTLGSDADGDIYYRSSNLLTRLPKGTALQQLRINAGATAPEWATIAGSGTVTVVSAGSLTDTAIVTGGGSATLRTPSATSTLSSGGDMSLAGGVTTGTSGSNAGDAELTEGTAPATLTANAVQMYAASDVQAAGVAYVWGGSAAATGLLHVANAAGVMTVTQAAVTLSGADVTGTLAAGNGGTGITSLGTGMATWWGTPSSLNLRGTLTDENGTGVALFDAATSPSFTTSIVTGSSAFSLLNTTATTVNAFGATTTLNIGLSATMILNFGGFTTASEFRFLEPSGSGTNYSAFKAVAQGANITYSLPPTVASAGQFLRDAAGDGVLSWATPAGSGTVTNTGGNLTANAIVLGAGTTDTKVVAGMTTNGAGGLVLGVNVTTIGTLKMFGNTSGDVTITPQTIAGTAVIVTLPSSDTIIPIAIKQITFAGLTAARTITFPDASITVARTDAANTFTGTNVFTHITVESVTSTGATGTGKFVFDAAPTINGLTFPTAGGSAVVAQTVASGTSALGTSAIGSGACASAVTTSATGTATTDVIWWGFNGDPTAVTGYVPTTAGMLTVISYPSADNVNFKVCNNTSASITPGAITLNWRVVR